MKTIRALVVLYSGEEISNDSLQQIRYLIHNDYSANGQGITCAQLESSEIAQLVTEAAAKAVYQQETPIQINVRNSRKEEVLNNACKLISDRFNSETTPLQLIAAYLSDDEIKNAMATIANTNYNELIQCKTAKFVKNKNFLKIIKEIVKEL